MTDESLTREQLRSRRKLPVRARTVSMKRLTKRELDLGRLMHPEDTSSGRPRTRGDCLAMERPCPYAGCRFHLFIDVNERTGAIKYNYPHLEIDQLPETCCLDVADQDGMTLEDVGELLNVTRERIRQIEIAALAKVSPSLGSADPEVFGGEAGPDRAVAFVAIDAEHAMQFGLEEAS